MTPAPVHTRHPSAPRHPCYSRTMPRDERDRLVHDPFAFRSTNDGRIFISRGGRTVTIVAGASAKKLAAALTAATDSDAVQHLLARATGNYRRGNEGGR